LVPENVSAAGAEAGAGGTVPPAFPDVSVPPETGATRGISGGVAITSGGAAIARPATPTPPSVRSAPARA
jgi:hypothetical protein